MNKNVIHPIGYKPKVNAWFNDVTIEIYEFIYGINDYVIASERNNLGLIHPPRKYKLYTNDIGTYFNKNGTRHYIEDFIRC